MRDEGNNERRGTTSRIVQLTLMADAENPYLGALGRKPVKGDMPGLPERNHQFPQPARNAAPLIALIPFGSMRRTSRNTGVAESDKLPDVTRQ